MDGWDEEFKTFFGYLILFAFLTMFWSGFKSDMARKNNIKNITQYETQVTQPTKQKVYRRVYVNNPGGPATVYYVR